MDISGISGSVDSPGAPASTAGSGRSSQKDIVRILDGVMRTLAGLGDEFKSELSSLAALRDRLEQGRFHLAVLGQFKRGKSTLLNALLGESVLPTAVIPVTAIPTFVRQGPARKARVFFQNGRQPKELSAESPEQLEDLLGGFVAETQNPQNKLGVLQVEVLHPSPILSKGLVLIDTPGVGSTFHHNTETALNFLPQCDGALFLVSADPPITEVEVEFLKQVRSRVPRLFFILNKVDYLDEEELRSALKFLCKVLTEQVGVPADVPVFAVSAKRALEARNGNKTLWVDSGLEAVERHLVGFLAGEKERVLREAVARKAGDVLAQCVMRLRLAVRSLQIPIEDVRVRLALFERRMEEVQRQRVLAADLLAGDCRRMHERLEEHAESLRMKAREYLAGIALETVAREGQSAGPEIQNELAEAIPGFFERLSGESTSLFRRLIADALRPHQDRANELIESIRKSAAELFEVAYEALEGADTFEIVQEPYWVTHKWISGLILRPAGLLNRLLPASGRNARLRKRLLDQVSDLVMPNVENLRWAIFQSIDRTFMQFGAALDQRLADTVTATHGAIRAALTRRHQNSGLAYEEITGLDAAAVDIERIRARLAGD